VDRRENKLAVGEGIFSNVMVKYAVAGEWLKLEELLKEARQASAATQRRFSKRTYLELMTAAAQVALPQGHMKPILRS
jgi:hypothetical protein